MTALLSEAHEAARTLPPVAWSDHNMGLDILRSALATCCGDCLASRAAYATLDPALRPAARRLAAEARAIDPVRAERLLLVLRRAWPTLPEVRRLTDDRQRGALWDRVVELCCEEFYAPVAAAATRPGLTRPMTAMA